MEARKAINVLKTEKKCVTRSDCNRDCFNCDFVMDADDIVNAYDLAIIALQEKQEHDHLR